MLTIYRLLMLVPLTLYGAITAGLGLYWLTVGGWWSIVMWSLMFVLWMVTANVWFYIDRSE